jgi:hypothetical protein
MSLRPVAVPMVTVNSAAVVFVATEKPATVTVRAPPGLIVAGESVTDLAVRVNAVSDTPTRLDESVAVKTIVELHELQATSFSVGIVVA